MTKNPSDKWRNGEIPSTKEVKKSFLRAWKLVHNWHGKTKEFMLYEDKEKIINEEHDQGWKDDAAKQKVLIVSSFVMADKT